MADGQLDVAVMQTFVRIDDAYLVVRFLAEDVTKRLPQVVEEISAALASRRSP